MSISVGIYNGMDYLPAMYHRWLADPKRSMFVAKSEGKVVGFGSFLLVDNGVTALLQAMRVAPWRRNRGIYKALQQFLFDHLQSNHSEVTTIRIKLLVIPRPSHLADYELVHTKAFIFVVLPKTNW
ncbi:hypothetical protein GDO86_020630 [Hymenochirus boettgeri]|uniref:N-acetyltransferase domain-containing protein n=1 Tax=Hymenochirus boettgeri TaxID=247094 RepID=A0A8T2INE8_9PIPI|nr:hypothetical protein GDO86_020630 [Hymenochirus boettgeri]